MPPPPPPSITHTCEEVKSFQRHYDIAISKFRNYHLLLTNIPVVLVIPFIGLYAQTLSLTVTIPNIERFLLLACYLLVFAFLYSFIFNLSLDTEQYIKRGCKPCTDGPTSFQEELKKFINNFAHP